jgi:hypothetical protein
MFSADKFAEETIENCDTNLTGPEKEAHEYEGANGSS